MKVNFDGLRKNATLSMNELQKSIKTILDNDEYNDIDDADKKDIIERFNKAAMFVDSFNCIYNDDKDDINDLSHLEINILDEEED